MYQFLSQLLMPFTFFCVVMWLAFVTVARRRVPGVWRQLCVFVPLGGLTLASMPPIAYLSGGSLEWRYPPQGRQANCRSIVVMGGHARLHDLVRKQAELDGDSLARCLHAARLYADGDPVPIIVCGGDIDKLHPGITLAEAMRDFLLLLGVPKDDVVVEDRSRNTFENAIEASAWLRDHNINDIVVVTDAIHLWRTELCFRKQGIEPAVSGCRYRATQLVISPKSFIPSPRSALYLQDAAHEWFGLAWYWLRGRI